MLHIIARSLTFIDKNWQFHFERVKNRRKEARFGEKKLVLARRSSIWREEARFGEKKLVLAGRSLFWRKEACFCEKKPDLAKRSLFWRKEARFGEKKLVLARRSPIWRKNIFKNGQVTRSRRYWRKIGIELSIERSLTY